MKLPHQSNDLFITDGGLETDLIFNRNVELPYFAAFTALSNDVSKHHMCEYFQAYFDLAKQQCVSLIVDTPTWRASSDWIKRVESESRSVERINAECVSFVKTLQSVNSDTRSVINGVIGPRGDGYCPDVDTTVEDSLHYHRTQLEAFRLAKVDMISAITMNCVEEAIGIALGAKLMNMPVVISFTVETNGCLPTGQPLMAAIEETERATERYPIYYMINCAHPSHFLSVIQSEHPCLARIQGIRANASCKSHEELDNSTELDRGNPKELAGDFNRLRASMPNLNVVGGCCGTDVEHIKLIVEQLVTD
ncbi:homocysteine S-methyltransferase family protein [Alteromonas oceanisediminis]|uniref:homocysteine S-methyltransferase family protein n=1 Tax=Alteromonas oceanisediminis TaxID=2836180 RepID=UPI001BDA3503|nr:homocysteine S-methyltransferase family protein [Alteromonas oceanisediminis]MBT0587061.1 homocysteine S-methyltransferase family protein [Alteromonas oceanisediminis]